MHISLPGRHIGQSFIYNYLNCWYYWPKITDIVAQFISSCDICKKSKSYRKSKQELLKLLPILNW